MPAVTEVAQEAAEAAQSPADIAQRWLASIKAAQKVYDKFYKRGDRITKRYRNDRERESPVSSMGGSNFNVFWSNVQTLAPATYSRRPKVEVFRRFRDQDAVGRLAGQILERALQYEVDCGLEFHHTLQACVLDRLLPGQAVAWVRYEPSFRKEPGDVGAAAEPAEIEVLADEKTPVDYVFWKDFLISPARTWADVRWVARRVMFAPEGLKARFSETLTALGGDISTVPCNYNPSITDEKATGKPTAQPGEDPTLLRALVWEIWDKESKQLFWVCEGFDLPLDIKDDPSHLEGFFPCPRPLWATMTNDQIVPVADYQIYRSQLDELDTVTNRISLLVSALRVVGVYDASQTALQTLLSSGTENRMVPVNSWAAFAEKGGLKGVMDFVPIEMIVAVLQGLYKAREELKQAIYEITGMADIVRGASVASETLGAQQIKAKFANLRLSSRQQQVAEFVTGILGVKAELMCEHYSEETLVRISSVMQLDEMQPQAVPAPPPQPGMPPQPPAPPQIPPKAQANLQAALALLKDDRARQYRITVAADSMIELDEVDERERRNEFMSTIANFFLAMKNIAETAPPMMIVALEMLKFTVRGFAVGRGLEAAIEEATDQIKKKLAEPKPPPPPTPDEVKLMIAKGNAASDEKIARLEIEAEKAMTAADNSTKLIIAGLETKLQALVANTDAMQGALQTAEERQHELAMQQQQMQQEQQVQAEAAARQPPPPEPPDLSPHLEALSEGQQKMVELLAKVHESSSKPRTRTPTRDAQGNIISVQETIG